MDGTGKSYVSALSLFWGIYDSRDILWEQTLDFHKVEMEKIRGPLDLTSSRAATMNLSCLLLSD